MAARLMTRGASAAAAAAGASAGGALVARHVVGGGSLRSSASTSTSTSTLWRGGLANGGADGVAAARGFAHASTPSYGHGHSHGGDAADDEKITVTFIEKDGTETVVQAGFFIFFVYFPTKRGEGIRRCGGWATFAQLTGQNTPF